MRLLFFVIPFFLCTAVHAQVEARINPLIPWGLFSEVEVFPTKGIGINFEFDVPINQDRMGSFQTGISYVVGGVPPFDFSYEHGSPLTLGLSSRFYVTEARAQNKGVWLAPFARSSFLTIRSGQFADDVQFNRHSFGGRIGMKWLISDRFSIDVGAGLGWIFSQTNTESEFGQLLERFDAYPLKPVAEAAFFGANILDYLGGGTVTEKRSDSPISRMDPTLRISVGYRF